MQTNIENYQNLLNNYDLNKDYTRLNADTINNSLNVELHGMDKRGLFRE